MTQVVAHGVLTDEQGVGDLPVAHALRQQRGDLQFPGGRAGGDARGPAPGDRAVATQVLHRMDQIRGAAVAGKDFLGACAQQINYRPFGSGNPEHDGRGPRFQRRQNDFGVRSLVASHADDRCPGRTWPDDSPTPLPHDGVGEYHSCQRGGDPVGEDRFRIDNDGSQGRGAQADSSAG